MMATVTTTNVLLTAEEYAHRNDGGRLTELVRGKVVEMTPPKPRHGRICLRIGAVLLNFVDAHRLGYVFGNDSGVITDRDPDTVRGPDVAYFSFNRLSLDADLDEYPTQPPELVFEVKSPTDRWPEITEKVSEYLNLGVDVVCVVDPEQKTVVKYTTLSAPELITESEMLSFPAILPGFQVSVRELFG